MVEIVPKYRVEKQRLESTKHLRLVLASSFVKLEGDILFVGLSELAFADY